MYENIILALCFAILVGLYLLLRKKVLSQTILAMLISAVWVLMSGLYTYKSFNLFIGNLSVFPFIAWTTGLVIYKEIFDFFSNRKNELLVFLVMFVLWFAGMIFIEYIGYNLLNIQLASSYSGFAGLPLMHMPLWGIIYYFVAGPMFILLCKMMDVE